MLDECKTNTDKIITSGQRILMKGRIACHAVIKDWMIPFAAYTTAVSWCFSMVRTISKIALSRGEIWTPSNTWFMGTRESAPQNPNNISIGSAVFAGLTNVTNRQTHTQTDHATPSVVTVTVGDSCESHDAGMHSNVFWILQTGGNLLLKFKCSTCSTSIHWTWVLFKTTSIFS